MNGLENSQDSLLYCDCLKGRVKDITAVVLAAGPSLDTFLPWVKAHQRDLLVVAVSRVCAYLKNQGITPDIMIHTDPNDYSVGVGKGIFHFPESLFAYTFCAHPSLVTQWPGMKVLLDKASIMGQVFPDAVNIHEFGSTVSNMAISLASYMGASRVVLLGIDLCNGVDGMRHAKGVTEAYYPIISRNLIKVETNRGGYAYSTTDYVQAANELEMQAQSLKCSGVTLVNPSPEAVKLAHVEYCPIEHIEIPGLERDVVETIRSACAGRDPIGFQRRLKGSVEKMLQELTRLEARVQSVLEFIRQLGIGGSKLSANVRQEMVTLLNETQGSESFRLALRISWQEIFAALKRIQEGVADERAKLNCQRDYLRSYLSASARFRDLLTGTLERVHCRQKELNGYQDIGSILDQWDKDEQPGRSLMIQEQVLESGDIGQPHLGRIQEMRRKFKAFLQEDQSAKSSGGNH
ncbi:6-hydroxymethylpterin diphosphokinase MptE-like protein [Solemya velesiana gill symbiont]|uniref:6-hydroxymethylpterin diphosphokinase MptE-like domain-containing protein n=1 Tax=Solemya velesiana gill symbiont TaxID=1918948 RepID=A0A1T2KY41_9GAMM|nr:6-hydroxymethylpterin diphosphokinase MptE-like protein [Solemya velesiana gill symbiont]OOZ37724.1 hypothetical protein BOW51_00905 [Solemya velesiana gill symbiont]